MTIKTRYEKRLHALQEAQSKGVPVSLRAIYATAVTSTQESFAQVARLNRALERRCAYDLALVRERTEHETTRVQLREAEAKRHEATLADPKSTDLQRTHARTMLALNRTIARTDVSRLNTEILEDQIEARRTMVLNLIEQLSENIFLPDHGQFKLAAVIDGLDVIMGAIPVAGNIYASLRALYNISTRRNRTVRAAHEYVKYLEDYCLALRFWNAAVEAAIRSLDFEEAY